MNEKLGKNLGLWDVFSIAAGAMISSGLFVLPGIAFEKAGPAMILCYACAGLLILPTMFAQAELSTAMPKSAGSYFAVERSLGAYFGTVAGLINWCAISLKGAFALVGIGTLYSLIFPDSGPWAVKICAVSCCLFFLWMNLVSVKETGRLQGFLVLFLIGILILFIGSGVSHVKVERYSPFFTGSISTFIAVIGMVFVSFGGLTKVVDVSEEIRDPGKNIPLGMFLAFCVVNALYVGVVFVTTGILNADILSGSLKPVTEASAVIAGKYGIIAMGIAAFLAYATTGNAGILSASRSPFAMSRDGLLPGFFSRTSSKYGTPYVSVILTAAVMVTVILLLSIEDLVKTASTMLLLSLALINVSVIIMRHTKMEGYRPSFKVPLSPWMPIATVILYGFLIAEMGVIPLLATLCFIGAASIWYVLYVQHKINREAAVMYLVKTILSKHIKRTVLEDELVQISLERDEIVEDRFDALVKKAPIIDIPDSIHAKELFLKIGDAMKDSLKMSARQIQELLLTREREFSTIIQPGLAIPHIVVDGENIFELALVRCREGAVFSELNQPVHTAFVLIGSADQRNFHLKALMAIAHIVQSPEFVEKWIHASNAEQLRDIALLCGRERHAVNHEKGH